jgi:AraC-like DNA-binding protein
MIFDAKKNLFDAILSTPTESYNTTYFVVFLGVFLRFYLMKMLYPVKSFSLINLKHFVLPIIFTGGGIFVQNFLIDKKILLSLQQWQIPTLNTDWFVILLFLIGFLYLITSLVYIIRFCNKQSIIFQKTNNLILIWLKIIIIITCFFMVLELILFLKIDNTYLESIVIGKHALIIALIIYIIVSPSTVKKMRGCVYVISETKDIYESYLLPRAFRGTPYDFYSNLIEDYISYKMPYLNMKFGSSEMASDLKISKQKLTLILKYVYQMDFFEFINRYRIYYFLELSNDEAFDSLNIEEQAKRVGFYHKSDFYYYFRKFMDPAPPLSISQDKYIIKREL